MKITGLVHSYVLCVSLYLESLFW